MHFAIYDSQIEKCLSYDFPCRQAQKEPLGESCCSLVSGEGWIEKMLAV